MGKDQISNKSILDEHGRIATARHVLALVNFAAILAGTVITLIFMGKRGCPEAVAAHVWILLVINIVQVGFCVADFVTKKMFGIYLGWLPYASYGVGGLWVLTLVGEMAAGASVLGGTRTDLIAIAAVQFVVALIAYLVWPMLDRKAIDAMIRPSVRDDEKKRKARSKAYMAGYIGVCAAIVLLQCAALLAYKLPPRPYDLFASSRAVEYELNDDGSGYVVKSVYRGTSRELNIPATYNDLPVVGIKSGALVEDGLLDKYKVSDITFGTPVKTEDGGYEYESNLEYVESGAISNDKITELTLPASVKRVGESAVKSKSLKKLSYRAAADFSIESYDCSALEEIIMEGESVGNIVSLDGMSHDVTIRVEKDIYNRFRQNNMEYIRNFVPTIGEDEFCVDFYTDSDYYIESIFEKKGSAVTLSYTDLKNNKISGVSPVVDTLAYIRDRHELDTDGVKKDSAFRGWYYNDAYTEECVFSENSQVRFTENTTLYAKWIDEYTGTFDWGTFKPSGAITELHWTSEDVVDFPEVTNRVGYADGVKWTAPGSNGYLADSSTLDKSVTLHGVWIFDKPTIDIIPNKENKDGFTISQSQNEISFTYDESRTLSLGASYSHTLDGTLYSFSWSRNNGSLNNNTESAYAKNVAEGGVYTLDVTAISPFGETSVATTSVTVDIARKPLGVANYLTMADKTTEYSNGIQTVEVKGDLPANNKIQVSFEYKDENGNVVSRNGVRNAGEYTVTAYYEKDNAADQANYAKESLQAKLKINKKVLTVGGWTTDGGTFKDFTTVYNGRAQSLTASLDGVLSGDNVQIRHSENVKTAAGSYTAQATEIYGDDAENYSFAPVSQPWRIDKKTITVSRWNTDGAFTGNTVTYDGAVHRVSATLAGAENGEALSFIYADNGTNITSASTAGTYSANIIGVSGATAQNYSFDTSSSSARYEWIVSPRTLTLAFTSDGSNTYDGTNNHGVTATVSNIVASDLSAFNESFFTAGKDNGVMSSFGAGYGNYSISFRSKDAGTYNVSVALKVDEQNGLLKNYALTQKSSKYTIDPKAITLSKDSDKTYNGSVQTMYVYVNGIVDGDLPDIAFSDFTAGNAKSGSRSGNSYRLAYEGKAAGDYPVSVTHFGNGNYSLTEYNDIIKVNKKILSVQWTIDGATNANMSVEYNGKQHRVSAAPVGVASGDTVVFGLTGNETATDFAEVGYTVKATLAAADYPDYSFADTECVWRITKHTLNPTWSFRNTVYAKTSDIPDFTYDGNAFVATPDLGSYGSDVVTLTYTTDSKLSASDAGTYNVSATGLSGADAANYSLGAANKSFTWKINPKTVTVSWGEMSGKIYNGAAQYPLLTLVGLGAVKTGATVRIYIDWDSKTGTGTTYGNVSLQSSVESYDISTASSLSGYSVNSDNYHVAVISISDGNYTVNAAASANTKAYSIAKKTLTLTGVWKYSATGSAAAEYNGGGLVYNKTGYTFTTDIADGVCGSDDVQLTYENNARANAGSATARVSGLSGAKSANYSLPGSGTSRTYIIVPASVTLTWNNTAKTYNASEQTVTATSAAGLCSGDTVATLNLTYTGNRGTDATSYTASATCGNNNYSITNPSFTWTIAQKPVALAWSASSYTYNGSVQVPTASYTYNGVTVRAATYGGDTTARNAKDGYTVNVTALDNSNFTLTGGTNISRTFNIAPRVVQLSWNTVNVTYYNGRSYSADVSISNRAGTDNVSLVYTTRLNGAVSDLSSNSVSTVGSYNVTVKSLSGTASANYTLTGTSNLTRNGAVVISPQRVTVSWTGSGTVAYDGKDHTLTAAVKGADDGQTVAVSGYSRGNTVRNAGSYTVTVASLGDPNYSLDSAVNNSASLAINKIPLTVSWEADGTTITGNRVSKVYKNADYVLTAKLSGVLSGDTVNIGYVSNKTTARDVGSHTFDVTLNGSGSANYELSGNHAAVLVITPAPVTIVWTGAGTITYDGQAHSITAAVRGVGGEVISVSRYSAATQYTDTGRYTVSISSLDNDNYTLTGASNISATLVINPAPVTVKWKVDGAEVSGNTHSIVYDGNAHTVTPVLTSSSYGGEIDYTFDKALGTVKSAGSYGCTISLSNPNLSTSAADRTFGLTVSKRKVELSWTNGNAVYDGTAKTLAATVTNTCGNDVVTLTYKIFKNSVEVREAKAAGEYMFRVESINNNDYTLDGVDTADRFKVLTITKADLKYSFVLPDDLHEGDTYNQAVVSIIDGITVSTPGAQSLTATVYLRQNGVTVTDTVLTAGTYEVVLVEFTGDGAESVEYAKNTVLGSITVSEIVPPQEEEV